MLTASKCQPAPCGGGEKGPFAVRALLSGGGSEFWSPSTVSVIHIDKAVNEGE